jgi:RNA polymerase sigma factor (sigma-70 family)
MNPDETHDLLPTRRTLLSRLKNLDNQDAWREFFEIYWQVIYKTARKRGCTHAEAQDVVQETMTSLSKAMPGFKYDPQQGSFKGWLLQLVGWRIIRQLQKRDPLFVGGTARAKYSAETATVERVPDPSGEVLEAIWDLEVEESLQRMALEKVKQKVDPLLYQIFDLRVGRKWPVTQVARFLGVTAGRVYLTTHRIGKLVRKEMSILRNKQHSIPRG